MKVVAINGSPRVGGNTETMLNAVLEPLKQEGFETKIIQIGGTNIHDCRGCWACRKLQNKKCVFGDDFLNDVLAEIYEADALILVTPSYFAGMSAEVKALIDRAGVVSNSNGGLLKRKVGAAVIAQRRGGGPAIQAGIHNMFLMCEMIIAGSTYWNFGFGMEPGEVSNDKEAMANMRNLGENIAWTLKKLNQ